MSAAPTYTYDARRLSADVVYRIRNLIRDTGEGGKWALSDEEILAIATLYAGDAADLEHTVDECRTAVALIRMNILRLAQVYDGSRSIGDLSVSGSGSVAAAQAWATALESICSQTSPPLAVSWGDPAVVDIPAIFDKGMHDNPEGSRYRRPNYPDFS